MRIKTLHLVIGLPLSFVATIVLSLALSAWKTSNTKIPARIASGEAVGAPDPADLRGSYTWADVSNAYGIPLDELLRAFGASDPAQKVNSLEASYGELAEGEIGTDSVRIFVARYLGLPYEAKEEYSLLLNPARAVLESKGASIDGLRFVGKGLPEASATVPAPVTAAASPSTQDAFAEKPTEKRATPSPIATPSTDASPSPNPDHAKPSGTVTGSTTFGQLYEWGANKADVEAVLGGVGADGEKVRDWVAARGLEFSSIKPKLQALFE